MSAGGSGAEGDCELNIAPIVDCFTVLIAYLLVSMSFISLGFFEAGVAATAPQSEVDTSPPPTETPLNFSIELTEGNQLALKLTGGKENLNQGVTLPPGPSGLDLEGLQGRIDELLKLHPDLKEANISADPGIRYKAIVKVIEAVKKTPLPKVFLASGSSG